MWRREGTRGAPASPGLQPARERPRRARRWAGDEEPEPLPRHGAQRQLGLPDRQRAAQRVGRRGCGRQPQRARGVRRGAAVPPVHHRRAGRHLRRLAARFIKNLACSGICASLVCVPFDIILSTSPHCCWWIYTMLFCKVVKFLHKVFCSVTILSFPAIALDRKRSRTHFTMLRPFVIIHGHVVLILHLPQPGTFSLSLFPTRLHPVPSSVDIFPGITPSFIHWREKYLMPGPVNW